jgi:membrane protein
MAKKSFWGVLQTAGSQWLEDRAPRMGAALAYYAVFSISPLLVIAVAIVGSIFGREAVEGRLADQLEYLLGPDGSHTVQSMVADADKPGSGIFATVMGVIMLVFGAMGLFIELQDVMNTVWKVTPRPGRAIRSFIRDRLLSLALVLFMAALLLVSLVVSAVLVSAGSLLGDWATSIRGQVIHVLVSLVVETLFFAVLFRFVPDVNVAWRDVWLGAILTAGLFTLGKWLIGLYVEQAGIASAYGAAGCLAALLVWVYYSAQILIFGAEFTVAYATRHGAPIVPADNAVSISQPPIPN